MSSFNLKFTTKAYSEREAWNFLSVNGPELNLSIRQLANLWNWHKSKVERFLKILRTETLIETKISQGKTTIAILTNSMLGKANSFVTQDNFEATIGTRGLEADQENLSRDNFEDNNVVIPTQDIQVVEENIETESRQFQDDLTFKEEKKKRSKKRKEEIKEKPLLKEGKKENIFSENVFADFSSDENLSSESDENAKEVLEEISTKLPVLKRYPDNVSAEDVLDWAEKNLPQNINIEWELEKFKEYHKSKGNKQMKDAVAFFRGWLMKSIEFHKSNNTKTVGGNNHEYVKFSQNRETKTEFERFLAGGYRAVDKLKGSGLVRQTC